MLKIEMKLQYNFLAAKLLFMSDVSVLLSKSQYNLQDFHTRFGDQRIGCL